jgi:tRNA threonylcarbamoyl adenosine modification protein YeaZ/ribosomal-protein-alanine acetyltransferase
VKTALAIDTAGERISVAAVSDDERTLAQAARVAKQGHVRYLSILVAEVMEAGGLETSDIERIAVDIGPGSFTGLRVGLATARGLARPHDLPVVGITSFAAMIRGYPAEDAMLVPLMPAGGRSSYAGFFRSTAGKKLRLLRGPAVGECTTLEHSVRETLAFCPKRTRVRLMGPAAVRDRSFWEERFPGAVDAEWRPDGPSAIDIGTLAFELAPDALEPGVEVPPYSGAAGLRPLYVRAPQAVERSLEGGGPVRPVWQELVVTPLTKKDLEEVLAIEHTVFGDPWPGRFFEDELGSPESVACAVRHRGKLVGYVLAWKRPEELHLGNFAVAAGHQRRGVGSFMVQWLLQEAHRRGAKCLTLEVRTSNFAAQELYRRFGFRALMVRKSYYQDNREDALVMIHEFKGSDLA